MDFGLNGITAFLLGISTQLILVYALFRQWFRFSTQTTLLVVAALKTMELCANEIVTDETRWILAILATLQTPLLIPLMKKGMRRLMLLIQFHKQMILCSKVCDLLVDALNFFGICVAHTVKFFGPLNQWLNEAFSVIPQFVQQQCKGIFQPLFGKTDGTALCFARGPCRTQPVGLSVCGLSAKGLAAVRAV